MRVPLNISIRICTWIFSLNGSFLIFLVFDQALYLLSEKIFQVVLSDSSFLLSVFHFLIFFIFHTSFFTSHQTYLSFIGFKSFMKILFFQSCRRYSCKIICYRTSSGFQEVALTSHIHLQQPTLQVVGFFCEMFLFHLSVLLQSALE